MSGDFLQTTYNILKIIRPRGPDFPGATEAAGQCARANISWTDITGYRGDRHHGLPSDDGRGQSSISSSESLSVKRTQLAWICFARDLDSIPSSSQVAFMTPEGTRHVADEAEHISGS